MVRRTVVSQSTRVQVLHLLVLVFFYIYFRPSADVRSVGGDVFVDYESVCGYFANLKMMCRLCLSEVLIRMSVCAYI